MFTDEHLYIVAYDIGDPKRWRRVFRLMMATANGCSFQFSSAA